MHQEPKTYIDIGLAIRQKMSEQGTTIAWLARQVKCDRSNLYRHLHNEHIYPELLLKISVTLKTNFLNTMRSIVGNLLKISRIKCCEHAISDWI